MHIVIHQWFLLSSGQRVGVRGEARMNDKRDSFYDFLSVFGPLFFPCSKQSMYLLYLNSLFCILQIHCSSPVKELLLRRKDRQYSIL
jgi:hypothetical protein